MPAFSPETEALIQRATRVIEETQDIHRVLVHFLQAIRKEHAKAARADRELRYATALLDSTLCKSLSSPKR